MAIFNAAPPSPEPLPTGTSQSHAPHNHQHHSSNAPAAAVDIETWTLQALEALSVSPIARGTGTPLSIPLDGRAHQHHAQAHAREGDEATPRMKLRQVTIDIDDAGASITPPRRPPSRRDSLRRRDALLKGKEGSRQRRRWENDRLLHVPNVEPPLPTDWEIRPTHPVQHVPYQLAQFWDSRGGLRERAEERGLRRTHPAPAVGRVPRDLRATVKRTPAVKGWLRELEEPVRRFLVERGLATDSLAAAASASDDEEEEIVFRGRKAPVREVGGWRSTRWETPGRQAEQVMVLNSLGDDESSAFKRWLTHSISDYYGLESRSVMIGEPARKVIYIGARQARQGLPFAFELPQPLWEIF